MIVWQGWGWLCFFLAGILINTSQATFGSEIGIKIGGLISGALLWIIGTKLAKSEGKVFIDAATMERIEWRRKDTFMFLPIRFWAVVYALAVFA